MTVPSPSILHVMKGVARLWLDMAIGLTNAWGERANRLNLRPKNDGAFDDVSEFINATAVKVALTKD